MGILAATRLGEDGSFFTTVGSCAFFLVVPIRVLPTAKLGPPDPSTVDPKFRPTIFWVFWGVGAVSGTSGISMGSAGVSTIFFGFGFGGRGRTGSGTAGSGVSMRGSGSGGGSTMATSIGTLVDVTVLSEEVQELMPTRLNAKATCDSRAPKSNSNPNPR